MPSKRHQLLEYTFLSLLAAHLAIEIVAPHHSVAQGAIVGAVVAASIAVVLALHQWRKELGAAYLSLVSWAIHVGLLLWLNPTSSTNGSASQTWLQSACLGLVLAVLAVWVFPLPTVLELTGPYKTIGCHTGRYGGVECRVFYPSSKNPPPVSPTERIQYLHHGVHLMKGLSVFSKVPYWIFNNLSNAYLSAVADAPIAEVETPGKGWPVVIFSHGLAGSLELYSSINQQLASEGNIVVVLNHCDGSASVFRSQEERSGEHRFEYYHTITKEIDQNIDGAGFRFRNKQLCHRVEEVIQVVNALEKKKKVDMVNKSSNGHLGLFRDADLTQLHMVGHSFGGATALMAAYVDPRFVKAVLLDTWMEPVRDEVVLTGLGSRIPVLHVISEQFYGWKPNFLKLKQFMANCSHAKSRTYVLKGSMHNNFSDLPLFSPVLSRLLKSSGQLDALQCLQVIGNMAGYFLREECELSVSDLPFLEEVEC